MAASYHHITHITRCHIESMLSIAKSQSAIAHATGYTESAISREISRNGGPKGYRADQAETRAQARRHQASARPTKLTPEVEQHLREELLKEDWSPVQISGRLLFGGRRISHQTIYNFVWKDKKQGGTLFRTLRHRGKPYRKKSLKTAGRGCIPNRVDIAERPQIVETKSRVGDWEGDTIIGASHDGAIVTYVDRCSKLTKIKKIPRRQAELVKDVTVELLGQLPLTVHSLTFDNGKEFSQHEAIAKALDAECYFAKPYHSYERGLNEHTNGLIRQYIPKGTKFSEIDDNLIQEIEDKLNHRPRKCLGFKTPYEVFYAHLHLTDCLALHF
jgi:IS30 family transposase